MPLPLLLAVPALIAVAGAGAKKANDGRVALNEAKDINDAAIEKYEHEKGLLDRADKRRLAAEQALGDGRKRVFDETIPAFIEMVSRLRNAEIAAEEAKGSFVAEDVPMSEIKKIALKQLDILGSASGAAVSGAVAGGAAITGATAFGAASTGTAISTLGGAAATNATLAWFGGGALAVGGGGMAAGAMVIGGVVAAPAILVGGLVFSNRMEKKVEEAQENAAEVDEYCAKAKTQRLLLHKVSRTCERGSKLIDDGADRLDGWTAELNAQADEEPDVKKWDSEEQERLKASGNLAGLLVAAAAIPHVNKNGRINKQFLTAVDRLEA